LANAVEGYVKLGKLPDDIKSSIQNWDDGDGLEASFRRHRAFWHIKCRQKLIHVTTLDRLRQYDVESEYLGSESPTVSDNEGSTCSKRPRLTRSVVETGTNISDALCIFCNKTGSDLRQVMTLGVDQKVRKCAAITENSLLLGKLAEGDLIATEAKYHPGCLLSLYYEAGRIDLRESDVGSCDSVPSSVQTESLALAEVIAFMEDATKVESTPSVFKLSEPFRLYSSLLIKYKVTVSSKVHSSRLKERLLDACPNPTAVSHNRDVLLTSQIMSV
jgi:hypothetical protein